MYGVVALVVQCLSKMVMRCWFSLTPRFENDWLSLEVGENSK